ncbi:flagellar biosynthesis repressor FlbT [Acuticoccus mangrovi]|uniref:Flagellar biosynthesis repressor FlbT n=1 Tax=Acuticoccus mangrovi TaxID=2796142 RepID=A0A934MID9_9HYPH|nr:flagellar biosynthesis repressor FlbT [Acuticoccus mangrovi]MBJ3778663.1 flagellar biosynthesis repressor FlbT [Acuticoccus mangrovi]
MKSSSRRAPKGEDTRQPGQRPMHLSLRAGERLFLNGAVFRVDRKVTLELLNDATFLLENHVLQVEDTHTPLRQLYFAVQAMLMDPQNAPASRALFQAMANDIRLALRSPELRTGVEEAVAQVEAEKPFRALKVLRNLFDTEAVLLGLAPEAERPRRTEPARPTSDTPLARDTQPNGAATPETNAQPASTPREPRRSNRNTTLQ